MFGCIFCILTLLELAENVHCARFLPNAGVPIVLAGSPVHERIFVRITGKTMSKCWVCKSWLLTGEARGDLNGVIVHEKCLTASVEENKTPLKTSPSKATKMSFEEQLTAHGRIGWEYEVSKSELHTRIMTQYPELSTFST